MLHYTPLWVQRLLPGLVWHQNRTQKTIYLTFDDGPIPEVTPWVLNQLGSYGAKASFFCVGENSQRYPQLVEQIRREGHTLGNHTYHHVNGWRVSSSTYAEEVKMTDAYLPATPFFRPPYGKLSYGGYRRLKNKYKIIMWDVLSGDFSAALTPQQCLAQTIAHTQPGSIVVFHDSWKAWPRLKEVLPAYLAWAHAQGYTMAALA